MPSRIKIITGPNVKALAPRYAGSVIRIVTTQERVAGPVDA
jgi:hypothetical protein